MTHTPEALDAIIAGLGRNRARFLLACSVRPKKWMAIRRDGKIKRATSVHGMIRPRGLVDGAKDSTFQLTPLGVAVRAQMMEAAND